MKAKCCRSAPRCATCPVLLAARARLRASDDPTAAAFAFVRAAPVPRELPPCVADALRALDERRVAA